jgi:hypothetical protein
VPRIAAGTGTSLNVGICGVGSTNASDSNNTFPGNDGNIYLSRILVYDAGTNPSLRGWIRGAYQMLNPVGLNDGDTFSGTGDFAGRSFQVIRGVGNSTAICLAIETTAWDTSS